MTATADDVHVEVIARGLDWSRPPADDPCGKQRQHVDHDRGIDMRRLEHTGLDHRQGPARTFLSRLKDELYVALDLASFRRKRNRRSKQHCSMRIVAARVHHVWCLRSIGLAAALLERQCTHV